MKKLFAVILMSVTLLPLLGASAYARDHENHFRRPAHYERQWHYNHWVYVPVYYTPPPVVYYYPPQPVYYAPAYSFSSITWVIR